MYHRILPKSDPRFSEEEPGMVVQPETFREHIRQLKQLFTIMSLSEWVDRVGKGKVLPVNTCTITFDDGWDDNYEYAFPIIQQEQVPVTLFAVSNMIESDIRFWPNRLAAILKNASPDQLRQLPWLFKHLPPTSKLEFTNELSSKVIAKLKFYPDHIIHQWLTEAESTLNQASPTTNSLVNWNQLKKMSGSGLVEVGSHTSNHYRLREDLGVDLMKKEIEESQQQLREHLGKPVDLFCYPNGDVSPAAEKIVRQCYKAAVTTRRGINTFPIKDFHQLSRIGLHQDISNSKTKLYARLSNWH